MDWQWIEERVVRAVHDAQLREHGGAAGIRDEGALQSALARPVNAVAYSDPDAADLAASLAYGLARNHPFVDGNKRTSFVVARLFLVLNGHDLEAEREEFVRVWLELAGGSFGEADLAAWLRSHMRRV